MNKHLKERFLTAIKDTFYAYNKYGARSNKKLIPIHCTRYIHLRPRIIFYFSTEMPQI